jgi:hypothetical protein
VTSYPGDQGTRLVTPEEVSDRQRGPQTHDHPSDRPAEQPQPDRVGRLHPGGVPFAGVFRADHERRAAKNSRGRSGVSSD